MPELPDVAGFKAYLDATSLHQTIASSSVVDARILEGASPRALARRLKGRRLARTHRHGKFLFAEVDGNGWLVLHFGMTGGLRYYQKDRDRPKHAKLILDLANGYHLAYTSQRVLGQVSCADDVQDFVGEQELGPDALAEGLDGNRFAELLSDRRGNLKGRLMDQSLVAGIGNVYSDEILFQAGWHPMTAVEGLDQCDFRRLYRVMRRVLSTAARRLGKVEDLPKSYLLPHRGEGDGCPRCGGKVRKMRVSGRGAYFCPNCQAAGKDDEGAS
jgi:formamidopyrimidine-DNA glycosylase